MSDIQIELFHATINKVNALIDYNVYDNIHKRYEFTKQTVLADKSLTEDVKTEVMREFDKIYDRNKVMRNEGTKRICENCNQECLATLYCELCVQNHLKANFKNWTSGNNDIDNLIQKCQMEALHPKMIVEWIPYNNLQNIKYLTKGGFSEIYTAGWIDGRYKEWDPKKQQLIREFEFRSQKVVLKKLENVESANQNWFEEAKSHLTISNKWSQVITQCNGLTQDPSNGNYMLVMGSMDTDLRKYLQQNHNQLTWKERIKIINDIIVALDSIHREDAIHRDLHSGNILYSKLNQRWFISDLGFCGPADKSSKSIYGNLPYIAPEVIAEKETTFKSDVYSFGMLMWEISSGRPPFSDREHDYYLATDIINGMRPKIVPGTLLEYERLMKQCWDADPLKRSDTYTLEIEIYKMYQSFQNVLNELKISKNIKMNQINLETNYTTNASSSSRLFTSKIHQFNNLPEPRNATEEEQEAFHSKSYDFSIPDNIDDFNNSNYQNDASTSKTSSILKGMSKKLSKVFKALQINSKNDIQNNDRKETFEQQTKNYNVNVDDEDEICNNPNFHSEEQDELEIPDDGF